MENLQERAIKAACNLMERSGCEIIEQEWECAFGSIDIIAKDEDEVIFARVAVCEMSEDGFPKEDKSAETRNQLEMIAANYLAETTLIGGVRFDMIALMVMGENKAFARWHKNFMSKD